MSVAKLRSSFDKKGCQIFLWIVMVGTAVGLAGAGFLGVFRSQKAGANPNDDVVVFSVDGRNVSLAQVLDATNATKNQAQSQGRVDTTPATEFQDLGQALVGLVGSQVVANMAAASGVTVTDDKAIAMASDQLDQAILSFRQQAIASGKLKTTSTEKEFQDFFKENQGMTAADFKSQRIELVKEALQDPTKRDTTLAQFSQQMLQQAFYNRATVTDDEVKKSYDSFMLKEIQFNKPDMSTDQRMEAAKEAIKELDSGTSFDKVAAKYMTSPAKAPQPYNRMIIEDNDQLRPLASLKAGQHSGIISQFGGYPSVFQLVEVKSDLPKDYDTNKAMYNDEYRKQKANMEYSKAIQDARKRAKIEWKIHGYQMIYSLIVDGTDQSMTEEQRKAFLTKVMNDDDLGDNPSGQWPSTLARYVASEQLNYIATDAEKKGLLEKRASLIQNVLTNTESVELRLTLVDIYEKLGDNKAMAHSLLDAANYNTALDATAQSYNDEINATLIRLENEKKIDKDTAKSIRERLIQWNKDKVADEQAQKSMQQYSSDLDKFNITPPAGDKPTAPTTGTTGG